MAEKDPLFGLVDIFQTGPKVVIQKSLWRGIEIPVNVEERPANCEPSGAGRSWKGGARERADDAFCASA